MILFEDSCSKIRATQLDSKWDKRQNPPDGLLEKLNKKVMYKKIHDALA